MFVPIAFELTILFASFAAVFGIFTLFYLHAYRQRHELELNELDSGRGDKHLPAVAAGGNAGGAVDRRSGCTTRPPRARARARARALPS